MLLLERGSSQSGHLGRELELLTPPLLPEIVHVYDISLAFFFVTDCDGVELAGVVISSVMPAVMDLTVNYCQVLNPISIILLPKKVITLVVTAFPKAR